MAQTWHALPTCHGDSAKAVAHPLEGHRRLMSCVRLLDARFFPSLPSPLPRSQDLPSHCFGAPGAGALVVSVSHAWRNQAHPDPTGKKMLALSEALALVPQPAAGGQVCTQLFLDFVSIPQRPFRFGQKARTGEERAKFEEALECMHEMYFYSDHIIHLPWDDAAVEGEGSEHYVPAAELKHCKFLEMEDVVQVSAEGPEAASSVAAGVCAFDVVVAIDAEPVTRVEQLERLLEGKDKRALLRRFPFGLTNALPADTRGWVFLERFITMVKCAMMDPEEARGVVITSSSSIFEEIMAGAARLRQAAQRTRGGGYAAAASGCEDQGCGDSHSELRAVLESFLLELDQKQFSPVSTDKREMDASRAVSKTDREAVTGIMRDFVRHLGQNWSEEVAICSQRSQRRRSF